MIRARTMVASKIIAASYEGIYGPHDPAKLCQAAKPANRRITRRKVPSNIGENLMPVIGAEWNLDGVASQFAPALFQDKFPHDVHDVDITIQVVRFVKTLSIRFASG